MTSQKCDGKRYARGCRCAACTLTHRERARRYRASGSGSRANITRLPLVKACAGEVREAVTAETMLYADRDPVACQQARTLADLLDDAEQVTLWPKAAAELQRILNRLRDGGKPARQRRRGRLASVQQLHRVK